MKNKRIIAAALCVCMTVPMTANCLSVNADTIIGDANGDGAFNVADLVAVQRWFLGEGEITNGLSVDFCADGIIDVFDFTCMKKALIEKFPDIDIPFTFTAENLCDVYSAESITGKAADEEFVLSQTEFALELLQNTTDGTENALISPYSVMQALAMTANGADGATKAEMEKVLGGLPIETLNEYLYTYRNSQGNGLFTANSIWTIDDEERIKVKPEFIQKNMDYYSADIFKAPFDDTTVKDINSWVNENTDEMIPKLVEDIDPMTVMYLINAVAMDVEWESKYYDIDVGSGKFTSIDGTVQDAEMLYSTERYYIQDENASGVYKYYKDRKYAFAAILPDEGVTVAEYIAGLTPERLKAVLAEPTEYTSVITSIPKFKYDYDTKLNETLINMGMESAFDVETADFTNMGTAEANIYIGRVVHKTSIELSEEGTRAAAVTSVEPTAGAELVEHQVALNRPFVYFIVDTDTGLPVFMGTLTSIPE